MAKLRTGGASLCDEWMPKVRVPMASESFQRLPRNAAYKYEYLEGAAVLSPRPRTYHAILDLTRTIPSELQASAVDYEVAPLMPTDAEALAQLFAGAFERTQPFAGLTIEERIEAAAVCLQRTFQGDDGPWVAEASFLLRSRSEGKLVGAILVTLLPQSDPADISAYEWLDAPPSDLWMKGQGQPHLTWIFTHAWHKGVGIGTRLLAATATPLREHGYASLLSTFIVGNDSSQLWHWRNGFELVPSITSKRPRLKT